MLEKLHDHSEKLSILVIEDNLGDFVLIEDYLLEKFRNITINHCSKLSKATSYLQSSIEKPTIILLDLNLPDRKGIELINEVTSIAYQIPIIALTGYDDLAMAKSSLAIGVYDYLVKDEISPDILHKTIIFTLNRSNFIHQIENEKLNYENLFNFNPQPTWLLDAKTLRILNANIAAQKKYDFSIDDLLKMNFNQLHPQDEEELIQSTLIAKENRLNRSHYNHILRNGGKINVDLYFTEININSNSTLIVQSIDVSETLSHINTIEVQNKQLTDIAWTQSHILRAPLARILGIINLVETDMPDNEELLFWLNQLKVSSIEMDDVIKNIVTQTTQRLQK